MQGPNVREGRSTKLASDRRRPDVAADLVTIGLRDGLEILVRRRARDPFRGAWSLPGVVCEPDETIEVAARRQLEAMGGLHDVHVEQLHTFSDPARDPRGWVISVAHLALVPPDRMDATLSADDAAELRWVRVVANKQAIQLVPAVTMRSAGSPSITTPWCASPSIVCARAPIALR